MKDYELNAQTRRHFLEAKGAISPRKIKSTNNFRSSKDGYSPNYLALHTTAKLQPNIAIQPSLLRAFQLRPPIKDCSDS